MAVRTFFIQFILKANAVIGSVMFLQFGSASSHCL